MTTKRARDFLDKELFVNRDIVTFRSLSRELRIHVNDAKSELQHYYDAVCDTDAPAVPTYLVSGEVHALTVTPQETQQSDCAMDLDLEYKEARGEVDVVHQSKVLLVDAHTLNEAKSQFFRIHSVHIYSLSPSRFADAGLVCTPRAKVREADAKGGPEFASVVGKITGSHVKLKAGVAFKNTATSSKTTSDAPARTTLKAAASVKTEPQMTKNKTLLSGTKEQASSVTPLPKTEPKDRPKPSGKLDWSKAKAKERELVAQKTKEDKKPKEEPKSTVVRNDPPASKRLEPERTRVTGSKLGTSSLASGDAQKRGVKRKPRTDSDQETESEPSSGRAKPSIAGGSSLKKGVVYSDDDDDCDSRVCILGQRRHRKSIMTSDSEMSLRVMMDIDDEQVDRVSRVSKTGPQREEVENSSEPEEEATVPPATSEGEEESDEVPDVPKKRKPRKVIPRGRNGLKKRRVVKSRTTTDAKGYMQTEDYSSYESVEEEMEVETKPKGKGKEVKKAIESKVEAKPKAVVKEGSSGKLKVKSGPKARGGAPKRGGLLRFFGPEKGKN